MKASEIYFSKEFFFFKVYNNLASTHFHIRRYTDVTHKRYTDVTHFQQTLHINHLQL